jgi:uncharacterized protein YjbJ (UPF0337 family)
MNWDQIQGNWKKLSGRAKEKWGKLTDNEITESAGRHEQLAGQLQERYGYAREEADRVINEFAAELKEQIPN